MKKATILCVLALTVGLAPALASAVGYTPLIIRNGNSRLRRTVMCG